MATTTTIDSGDWAAGHGVMTWTEASRKGSLSVQGTEALLPSQRYRGDGGDNMGGEGAKGSGIFRK